jgi:hypothetical protein
MLFLSFRILPSTLSFLLLILLILFSELNHLPCPAPAWYDVPPTGGEAMWRMLAIIVLLLTAFVVATGQTNQKVSAVDSSLIEEIKRMDRQWIIEAYSSKDLKDFDRIVAEDFLITGGNGKLLNKAQKRANVLADSATEPSPGAIFKIEETSPQVRVFDKTAISTGYIIENYTYKGNKINDRVYFTNTYLKRGGRWQVVASQFTRVKQQ